MQGQKLSTWASGWPFGGAEGFSSTLRSGGPPPAAAGGSSAVLSKPLASLFGLGPWECSGGSAVELPRAAMASAAAAVALSCCGSRANGGAPEASSAVGRLMVGGPEESCPIASGRRPLPNGGRSNSLPHAQQRSELHFYVACSCAICSLRQLHPDYAVASSVQQPKHEFWSTGAKAQSW